MVRNSLETLIEALNSARKTMRNASSAIQSGQIVDKEVDRQLIVAYKKIDELLKET